MKKWGRLPACGGPTGRLGCALLLVFPFICGAAQKYPVTGIVLTADPAHKSFTATCDAIPNFMEAMTMSYRVRSEKDLAGITPGLRIDFTLAVESHASYAESIHPHHFESTEQDPMRARRLQLLEDAPQPLAVGKPVPDFTLTDQTNRPVSLAQFKGKVVAITFIYTNCPLPDYCFRLSNNFGRINKRFIGQMARDLILLSISFDPAHDTPDVLHKYAQTWNANPASWHFLTGAAANVKAVCRLFGLNFWQDEGSLTHSLHTVIIDRSGKIAANLEGNDFSADQLGDLIAEVLKRPN